MISVALWGKSSDDGILKGKKVVMETERVMGQANIQGFEQAQSD